MSRNVRVTRDKGLIHTQTAIIHQHLKLMQDLGIPKCAYVFVLDMEKMWTLIF